MSDQRDRGGPPARCRADVRRNRAAVLAATARLLRAGAPLSMTAVAEAAGVSRSILYRHFGNPVQLQRALKAETLGRARAGIHRSMRDGRPVLAELRAVVAAIVGVGAELPLDAPAGPPPGEAVADAAEALRPLAERLARAAGLEPALPAPWLDALCAHLVETGLRAGWAAPHHRAVSVEGLLRQITEPLDRGLLLLDGDGVALALNAEARRALDVTDERRFELARIRPPGELRSAAPPLLDVVRALDEVPPALLPEQVVAEATRLAGGPVGLYVLDIDGSRPVRLAGRDSFRARLAAPLALGPELAEDGLPELRAHLARELPGVVMAPMWLRGRAVGILLALRGSEAGLHEVA